MEAYRKKYHRNKYQFIVIDTLGTVIKTDNILKTIAIDSHIENFHPFFESIISLFEITDEHFSFSCVNLDFKDKTIIADISIHTHSTNEHLIIIEDLTNHYIDYQLTAQTRNESIINTQVLELKNKYLLEKEQFKNNFIANFSHQLRNPITASSIFSEFLVNTNLNSEQKNYLDIILSANNDLKNRIEDILDLAKIESGKLTLKEDVFNLPDFLNKIASAYVTIAKKRQLDFILEIDPKLPEFINGDQYRFKQIIGNLINNAIFFTKEGFVKLTISVNYIRADKVNIQIEVIDSGIGIDVEEHDAIFERFNKANSNIKNNRQIGLGLSIVKHLVDEMKGNISIISELGKGALFKCNLSFKIANKFKSLAKKENSDFSLSFNKKKNILLVEDSELIQLSILKILSANGNFYLNILSNGEDVISALQNQDVDLIIISNTIQRYSAEELATAIRSESKELKRIPILVISSEVFKEDIKRYKASGIKDIITKPFDDKSLLKKLYMHIKK